MFMFFSMSSKRKTKGAEMEEETRQVGFYLPVEMIAEIDRVARKRRMNKTQVYKMMIDLGLQCHRDMEKVGIIAAVDFSYFVRKALKDRLKAEKNIQLKLI